jgi:hypothetical protein
VCHPHGRKGGPADWNSPIWKHDLDKGLRILRLGVDTHLITSHHLLPLAALRRTRTRADEEARRVFEGR